MKVEIQKSINTSLEKIIEDLTEILALLKSKDGSKYDQTLSLVFGKRRIIDLSENVEQIFRNLVLLKYLKGNKETSIQEKSHESFEEFFHKSFNNFKLKEHNHGWQDNCRNIK